MPDYISPARVRNQVANVEAGSLTRRQASIRCGCTGTAIAYQARGQGQQLHIAISPRLSPGVKRIFRPRIPSPNKAFVFGPRVMRPGDALATIAPKCAAA